MSQQDPDQHPAEESDDPRDVGLDLTSQVADTTDEPGPEGSRRARRRGRGLPGCLAVLVVLALIGGGVYLLAVKGVDRLQEALANPNDYRGPGTGQVTFKVEAGDTASVIARALKDADVVASVDAFVSAANSNPDSGGIQVGTYALKKKMSADGALDVLVDPGNLINTTVTIPEGSRVDEVVAAIAKGTDFSKAKLKKLVTQPAKIGLPPEADGDAEGYLFPATYTVNPGDTARGLLSQMVAKTKQVESDGDISTKARRLGLTAHQVITVASILEYEANNNADYAKVARVIYNRLDAGMALQLDSTITFLSQRKGDVFTTAQEREVDSPYNTYLNPGLPPGPIGSPGEAAIRAALNPAKGDFVYFVPDFANGTTLFAVTYAQHLRNVEKAKEFCRNSPKC